MATADELLREGDLDGARAALVEIVRSRPGDVEARMFLFQLFAVIGEWGKAKLQLDTLAQVSPEAQMLSVAYGQAIAAEAVRAAFFASGGDVPVHGSKGGWAADLAISLSAFAKGDAAGGDEARERAFDAAPETPGTIDGVQFDWIADADGRFGPAIEAIIGGQWGIVPFDVIAKISSTGARDLRDLVWYPVQIMFKNDQSVAAMLPARYPGTDKSSDNRERLGRATSWSSGPSGDVGCGQRLLSLSTGDDIDLLSLRSLVFD